MRRGFSLVELSIVLVILGLLVGGIMVGQSLLRAAELRSVNAEYSRFMTATRAFRDQYLALPGDFRTATRYWNRQQTSNCVSNWGLSAAGTPGVCDGNADGLLTSNTMNLPSEIMQFWRHLALAGFIEGSYSGLTGPDGSNDAVIGENVPASRLKNAGWSYYNAGYDPSDPNYFAYTYTNLLYLGGNSGDTISYNHNVLKPDEALSIDIKMDDGKPGTGMVIGFRVNTCTNAANNTSFNADYIAGVNDRVCALLFRDTLQ